MKIAEQDLPLPTERPDARKRSPGFSLLPPSLKQRAVGYAMAGLIAATCTLSDFRTSHAQTPPPETPIGLTTGPEKIGMGEPSALFIAGQSSDPPQARLNELVNIFAGALVERGLLADNMDLYAMTENLDFPGHAELITEEMGVDGLYKVISDKTQNATAPLLLGMVGHGFTNRYGNFELIVKYGSVIKAPDLAKAFAQGIQNHNHNSPVDILIAWESCGSGGALVGGPDDTTPFNDKGQTNIYDQILRELQRLNPNTPPNEIRKWFSIKQFAPTLPDRVASGINAYWEYIANAMSQGMTIEQATISWSSSPLNIHYETSMMSSDMHTPTRGNQFVPQSRIYTSAHSGGITLAAGTPIPSPNHINVPLIIENYTQVPYTMTARIVDSSGNVRGHLPSIPISVSPTAARPVTATLNIDPSALGVYTGTLELVDQNDHQYKVDFDTRRDRTPHQLSIPPENLQPLDYGIKFDPYGFILSVPIGQLSDGNYTAQLIAPDDNTTTKRFSVPDDNGDKGMFDLHSNNPRSLLTIFDDAGNIVHKGFYSAREEDNSIVDAMAREPLVVGTVYTGTVFITSWTDRDIYKLPLGTEGMSIALNEDPAHTVNWRIYLGAYNQEGEYLGIFQTVAHGDSKLVSFPQNTAYVEVGFDDGITGKETPPYSFVLNNKINRIFIPAINK